MLQGYQVTWWVGQEEPCVVGHIALPGQGLVFLGQSLSWLYLCCLGIRFTFLIL